MKKESTKLTAAVFNSDSEININDPEAILVKDRNFCPIVTELVNNCLMKNATTVIVTIELGKITVEDNVKHEPGEIVSILANVRSERPKTTKPPDEDFGFPIGGVGIWSSRRTLEKYNGQLLYEVTSDGRIIAIATWDADLNQFLT